MKKREFREAIALLRPHAHNSQTNMHIFGMLANAYIKTGNPKAAIALLKPLHESGRGNTVTTNTLGNACATAQNENLFYAIKAAITPSNLQEYLEAKIKYLNGDIAAARRIVRRHIAAAPTMESIAGGILSIFLATTPAGDPLLGHMKAAMGDERFNRAMERAEAWKRSPLRVEMEMVWMSSSSTLFELGAYPVSGSDRNKAGLDRSMPVAARALSFHHAIR